ncbi:MAG: radical SAM protein [Candidatus Hydrogenedentes bacterium]|nr:radical SAM protein [Candidatus Hydrogenedentota bacterium]
MGLVRKYGQRVVTREKVRNYILAQREKALKAVEVKSLPYILNLDTLNGCNLKCPFCPTGTGQHERPKARLPLEHAKNVIDAVKDHVLEVRFYNWGEPFLNPNIFEIIRHAREAGLYTIINSNFSIRVDHLAEKILDSGLDFLSLSVDGLEQGTLEIYRRKANSELVFENVRKLVAARRGRGLSRPRIELAFLVFRHNEHEVPRLEAMGKELGVDHIYPRRAYIFHESLVPEHPDFQPRQYEFTGTCDFLYQELTIEATGSVSPCCTSMSSKWDIGKIQDLEDMRRFWNAPEFRAMRALYAGDRNFKQITGGKNILCQYCSLVSLRPDGADGRKGKLSPLPPSFVADGKTYAHGFDNLKATL